MYEDAHRAAYGVVKARQAVRPVASRTMLAAIRCWSRRRVAQDRAQLGDLRGKAGFFAGARAKAERASAERAADLVAPSLECIGAAEARAAQTFRASVAA
jgi:hypothetical protein